MIEKPLDQSLKEKIFARAASCLRLMWHFLSKEYIITLVGIVLITPVVTRSASWFIGPSSYKIYFVGNLDQTGVVDSWRGIKSSLKEEQIEGISIDIIQMDAKQDDAEQISKRIISTDDAILVVGHFGSTASSHALNQYMLANPPIPVILPIESNPDLDVRDSSRAYSPFFRLAPTDEYQAEAAANFAEEVGAKRIWVIEDAETNPIYTRYLAAKFIELIAAKYDEKSYLVNFCEERKVALSYDCDTIKKWASQHYHARVVLKTNVISPPTIDDVKSLDIDFVFFVGQTESCHLITNELGSFFKHTKTKPTLLAAKGCESRLGKLPDVPDWETYAINHVPANDFYDREYEARPGIEAGLILKDIFDRVRQSRSLRGVFDMGFLNAVHFILGWHSAPDLRRTLASEMERSIEKTAFPGATNKHDLKFRKNGEVIGKEYIIWRLDKSDGEAKFVDLKPERKNSIASTTTNSERKVEFKKAGQRTKVVSQN